MFIYSKLDKTSGKMKNKFNQEDSSVLRKLKYKLEHKIIKMFNISIQITLLFSTEESMNQNIIEE